MSDSLLKEECSKVVLPLHVLVLFQDIVLHTFLVQVKLHIRTEFKKLKIYIQQRLFVALIGLV